MPLALFHSTKDSGVYAVTADPTGGNLPEEAGPWRQCTDAILTDGGMLADLVTSDAVGEVVASKGWYLARVSPTNPPSPPGG
jgi:hypothetical protein